MRKQENNYASLPEWIFFQPEDIKNTEKASCKLCGKVVPTKGKSTQCMRNHLRFRHEDEYNSIPDIPRRPRSCPVMHAPQNSPTKLATKSVLKEDMKMATESIKYCQTSTKWNELTEAVTYCVVKDKLPLRNIEKQSFSAMLAKFDGKYVLPSRHYFSFKAVPAMCKCMREKLKGEFPSIPTLAMSCTVWSDSELKSYISFASHYIDSNWDLQIQKLDAEMLPEGYTSTDIANAILNVTEDWGIEYENITALTIDNGSEITTACASIGLPRVLCFGDTLNAAMASALKEHRASRALATARQLVAGFLFSEPKKKELLKVQVQFDLPQHALVSDNSSKWLSTFVMLERLLEQQPAISGVLSSVEDASILTAKEEDFEAFQDVVCALKSAVDLVHVLSSDQYIGMSSILPIQTYLNETMRSKPSDSEITQAIKSAVVGFVKKKLKLLPQNLVLKATLMDPRFKHYVGNSTEEVRKMLCLEFSYIANDKSSEPKKDLSLDELLQTLRNNPEKSNNFYSKTPSPYEVAVGEMEKYCSLPPIAANADPLLWWKSKTNAGEFKLISKLAKKYLCCCATSSTSDQFFSTSKKKQESLCSTTKGSRVTKSKLFQPRSKKRFSRCGLASSNLDPEARNNKKLQKANDEFRAKKRPVTEWCSSTKVPPAKAPSSILICPRSSSVSSSNTQQPSPCMTNDALENDASEKDKKAPLNVKGGRRKPNLKNVRGKIHSMENIHYTPGGGKVTIQTKRKNYNKIPSKYNSIENVSNSPKRSQARVKIESKSSDIVNSLSKSKTNSNTPRTPSSGKVKKLKEYFNTANTSSKRDSQHHDNLNSGIGKFRGADDETDYKHEAQFKTDSMKNSLHVADGGDVSTSPSLHMKDSNHAES